MLQRSISNASTVRRPSRSSAPNKSLSSAGLSGVLLFAAGLKVDVLESFLALSSVKMVGKELRRFPSIGVVALSAGCGAGTSRRTQDSKMARKSRSSVRKKPVLSMAFSSCSTPLDSLLRTTWRSRCNRPHKLIELSSTGPTSSGVRPACRAEALALSNSPKTSARSSRVLTGTPISMRNQRSSPLSRWFWPFFLCLLKSWVTCLMLFSLKPARLRFSVAVCSRQWSTMLMKSWKPSPEVSPAAFSAALRTSARGMLPELVRAVNVLSKGKVPVLGSHCALKVWRTDWISSSRKSLILRRNSVKSMDPVVVA
mmetsp:Transcript_18288/g.57533  ORF Transcript_18288/g.57533 Transcript_18288/m.57533 type:complete len:312 (+) Transcript_18288:285-1220(+)